MNTKFFLSLSIYKLNICTCRHTHTRIRTAELRLSYNPRNNKSDVKFLILPFLRSNVNLPHQDRCGSTSEREVLPLILVRPSYPWPWTWQILPLLVVTLCFVFFPSLWTFEGTLWVEEDKTSALLIWDIAPEVLCQGSQNLSIIESLEAKHKSLASTHPHPKVLMDGGPA